MSSISLCMIVRDEEAAIARCLQSAANLVDEIVIVDTGSTDATVEICRSFGAKVYAFTWRHDFSAARNHALEQASGEWILVLDADDELPDGVTSDIRGLTDDENCDAYFFVTKNLVGDERQPTVLNYTQLRLFRNRPHFRYIGRIHELIPNIHEAKYQVKPVTVIHHGYLDAVVKSKDKIERNISMLKQALEREADSPSLHYYLGNEYLRAGKMADASSFYEQAQTLQKHANPPLWLPDLPVKYAYALWQTDQIEAAVEVVRASLVGLPLYTDLWFLLGHLYLKKRQMALARSAFEECLRLGPPPPMFPTQEGCGTYLPSFSIGLIAFEEKDVAGARAFFEQSWEWNPGYMLALTHLCMCDWIEEKYEAVSERLAAHKGAPLDKWVVELIQLLNQSLSTKKILVNMADQRHAAEFITCLQTLMSFGQINRAGGLLCQFTLPIQQSLMREEWYYELYARYWFAAVAAVEAVGG